METQWEKGAFLFFFLRNAEWKGGGAAGTF